MPRARNNFSGVMGCELTRTPNGASASLMAFTSRAAERSLILVGHKMKPMMGICERLLVLHHGEFLAEGTPEQIRSNAEVRRVYLGEG